MLIVHSDLVCLVLCVEKYKNYLSTIDIISYIWNFRGVLDDVILNSKHHRAPLKWAKNLNKFRQDESAHSYIDISHILVKTTKKVVEIYALIMLEKVEVFLHKTKQLYTRISIFQVFQ